MSHVGNALDALDRLVTRRLADVRLSRAVAKAFSSGRVRILDPSSAVQSQELYARLRGFNILADEEVIVGRIGGKPVVLGALQRATPTGYTLDAPLIVQGSLVSDGNDNYRDVASTQSASDTASTTSTSVPSVAMTLGVTLPAGSWSVTALGWVALVHSASGAANVRVNIAGTGGAARVTPNLSSSVYTPHPDNAVAGVSGGGTVNVDVEFWSNTAGTTTADSPALLIIARRTGP